ncbi:hypothetical protein KAH37_08985 [bacterium]|nr:hypothetical protein [bacterium]
MKRWLWLVVAVFALMFAYGCKKQESVAEKAAPKIEVKKTVIPEECKKFIPPWGEEYWETWGKANGAEFEKWYGSIIPQMMKVNTFDDKKCGMLENVFIGFSKITDLTPFSKMKNLRKLDMRFAAGISDLTPLSHSDKLEFLSIWKTAVTDFTPISHLPNLKRIDAKMTEIVDVTPLKSLTSLKSVDLLQTKVTDVSALASLPNIHEVLVCSTAIADISAFYPIAQRITYLDLCNTTFRDFKSLPLFTNLTMIKLWGVPLTDMKYLSGMKNLEYLDLWNAGVTDISPLFGLKKLSYLVLKGCKVPQKQIEELKKRNKSIIIVTDD